MLQLSPMTFFSYTANSLGYEIEFHVKFDGYLLFPHWNQSKFTIKCENLSFPVISSTQFVCATDVWFGLKIFRQFYDPVRSSRKSREKLSAVQVEGWGLFLMKEPFRPRQLFWRFPFMSSTKAPPIKWSKWAKINARKLVTIARNIR